MKINSFKGKQSTNVEKVSELLNNVGLETGIYSE
jgi:hypothetical protein